METELFPKLINTVNAFVFLEFHFDSAYSADKAISFSFRLVKTFGLDSAEKISSASATQV